MVQVVLASALFGDAFQARHTFLQSLISTPFFGKTNPQITAVPSFLEYRRTKLSSTGLVSQQT